MQGIMTLMFQFPLNSYLFRSQLKQFRRKGQLRLSELWVTDCMDKSVEAILQPNTYFVIGWPFTNCVAAFSTPDEKDLWFNMLKK